ncbi:MAG: thermonuclease family protein [Rhizobiales bacterium]|nr:thermonuclease family protein [Hyphomicrobiales bacterium]
MFLHAGLLSRKRQNGALLAAVTFVTGLGIGATIGPVTASRNVAEQPRPVGSGAASGAMLTAHPVDVLRVIDGDTFEARVNLWPDLDVTTRVRLRGVDAPELKARCGEERVRAEGARDALRAILDQGGVGIAQVTLDKYGGRVVADAFTHTTPSVSSALIDAGMARRYGGGRRAGWCG